MYFEDLNLNMTMRLEKITIFGQALLIILRITPRVNLLKR